MYAGGTRTRQARKRSGSENKVRHPCQHVTNDVVQAVAGHLEVRARVELKQPNIQGLSREWRHKDKGRESGSEAEDARFSARGQCVTLHSDRRTSDVVD